MRRVVITAGPGAGKTTLLVELAEMGLALAGSHMPVIGGKETAKRRMGMKGEPAVASYDNPT